MSESVVFYVILGLAVALGCWLVLRYARSTGNQPLGSVALWGIWIGGAIAAIGLAWLAMTAW